MEDNREIGCSEIEGVFGIKMTVIVNATKMRSEERKSQVRV